MVRISTGSNTFCIGAILKFTLMFLMTSSISFQNPNDLEKKSNSGKLIYCTWKNSIKDICNTAEIVLSNKIFDNDESVLTEEVIKPGAIVKIECKYNHKTDLHYTGFVIKVIEEGGNLKVICDGYSKFLKDISFIKKYHNPSLKRILKDLIVGTEIKLCKQIEDIILEGYFDFVGNGVDALEKIKRELLVNVFFNKDELFVGNNYRSLNKKIKYKEGCNMSDATFDVFDNTKANSYYGTLESSLIPFAKPMDHAIIESSKSNLANQEFNIVYVEGRLSNNIAIQKVGFSVQLN